MKFYNKNICTNADRVLQKNLCLTLQFALSILISEAFCSLRKMLIDGWLPISWHLCTPALIAYIFADDLKKNMISIPKLDSLALCAKAKTWLNKKAELKTKDVIQCHFLDWNSFSSGLLEMLTKRGNIAAIWRQYRGKQERCLNNKYEIKRSRTRGRG